MIAEHDAKQRFDTISDMAADIADLKQKLADMTAERDQQRKRADQAEARERGLYAQLTSPAREVKTLYAHMLLEADRDKLDVDLAKMVSAGWEKFDSGIIPGDKPMRFVTLTRVAPIPAEPVQPTAATVVVAATKPVPAATPDPAPDSNPDSLPVTRKTVSATAILIVHDQPDEMPAIVDPDSIQPDPPMTRGEEVKAAAQNAFNEALARNPLPAHRPLSSFKPVQGSAP